MQPLENLDLLVVEDHHDLASTVIEFLESMGASVDYAADGMTASQSLSKQRSTSSS